MKLDIKSLEKKREVLSEELEDVVAFSKSEEFEALSPVMRQMVFNCAHAKCVEHSSVLLMLGETIDPGSELPESIPGDVEVVRKSQLAKGFLALGLMGITLLWIGFLLGTWFAGVGG